MDFIVLLVTILYLLFVTMKSDFHLLQLGL